MVCPWACRATSGPPGRRGARNPWAEGTSGESHNSWPAWDLPAGCSRSRKTEERFAGPAPGQEITPHTPTHPMLCPSISVCVPLFSVSLSASSSLSFTLSFSLSLSLHVSLSLSLSLPHSLPLYLSLPPSLPPSLSPLSLLRSQANIRPAARFVNFKFLSAVRPHDPGRFGSSRRCPYRPVLVAAPCFFCLRTHSPLLPYHCATLLCLCSQQGGCSK